MMISRFCTFLFYPKLFIRHGWNFDLLSLMSSANNYLCTSLSASLNEDKVPM